MSFNFNDYIKNDNVQLYLYIFGWIIILAIIGVVSYFLWQRALNNGATVAQVYVGKKIGELCTSDAMCGTNKCRRNICII
jgi:hypothetical protein